MKRFNWILSLAGLGALALVVRGFLPEAEAVEFGLVEQGPFEESLEARGRTRLKDRYVIDSPVDAHGRRVELEVGDAVEPGQVLVRVDPLPASPLDSRERALTEERVAVAQAALSAAGEAEAVASADADYSALQAQRLGDLYQSGNLAEDEFDAAIALDARSRALLRSACFATRVAEHELHLAELALELAGGGGTAATEPLAIRSPLKGSVLAVHTESAGVLRRGEPMLEIGDPQAMEVVVDLLSAQAVAIQPGMRVLLERWGGPAALEAVVRRVEPTAFTKVSSLGVEEQRVWVVCDLLSERSEWERLGDGYRVTARFILFEARDVLQVPSAALFPHDGGWAVFVEEGGRARRRDVELGRRTGIAAEIRGGLQPGERVVVRPSNRIAEGTRLRAR